jgi:predicted nucleic acid-binding protein
VLLGSHRQITDGYLLALARAHDGVVATLDRGILALAKPFPEALEIVEG